MFRRRDTAGGPSGPPRPDRSSPPRPPASHLPTAATTWASSTRPSRRRMSKRREGADLTDFVWYHAFELPDGTRPAGRVGPARTRVRVPRWGRPGRQARPGARTCHRCPHLLHGAHGGRGGLLRGRVRRVHRHAPGQGRGPLRGTAADHAGDHRPQPRRLVVPAPHPGLVGQVRAGEHLRHAGRSRNVRRHRGRGHPAAPARAVGCAVAGGAAHDGDHDRHRAAAGRPRSAGDQHHALLTLGRAPPDQLVVDLPGRRRLHAGPARLRADRDHHARAAPPPGP